MAFGRSMQAARLFAALLPIAALSAAVCGADSRKPFTEWTEREALAVLTDSPWARVWSTLTLGDDNALAAKPPSVTEPATGGGGQHDNCCRTFGTNPDVPDPRGVAASSVAGPAGDGRILYFRVFWLSAMRIRQAMFRLRQLHGEPADPAVERALNQPLREAVIAVTGPTMNRFERATFDELRASTWIAAGRDKRRISPAEFIPPHGRSDRMALFVFPRRIDGRPLLDADDAEAEFVTGEGAHRIRVVFKIAKMKVGGSLDY